MLDQDSKLYILDPHTTFTFYLNPNVQADTKTHFTAVERLIEDESVLLHHLLSMVPKVVMLMVVMMNMKMMVVTMMMLIMKNLRFLVL